MTPCGDSPGTRHQPASSTMSGVDSRKAGWPSAPPPAMGALPSRLAPGGGTNAARIAAASAFARACGDCDDEDTADVEAGPPGEPSPACTELHPASTRERKVRTTTGPFGKILPMSSRRHRVAGV